MTEYDRKWQKITESDSTRWQKDNHNMKQTSYLVISLHEATSCRWNVPQCRWNVLLWKSNAWVKMIQVTVHMDCRALASIPGIPAEGWDARHSYATLCHRRTAHALDELHTWDLEHKKEYRKAKPFIFKTCWGHPEMAKGQPQHGTDILSSHISARGDFL